MLFRSPCPLTRRLTCPEACHLVDAIVVGQWQGTGLRQRQGDERDRADGVGGGVESQDGRRVGHGDEHAGKRRAQNLGR